MATRKLDLYRLTEGALMALWALESVRILLSMLFARVYDAVFDGEGMALLGLSAFLVLGALLAPLLAPREPGRAQRGLPTIALLTGLTRTALSVDIPLLRLIFSTVVLALVGVYLAALLSVQPRIWARAMALGAFTDQALCALGSTFDPSLHTWWIAVQLALVAVLFVWSRRASASRETAQSGTGSFLAGFCFGPSLFLLSSLFALPNAGARWAGMPYGSALAVTLGAAGLSVWVTLRFWPLRGSPARQGIAIALEILFLVAALATAYRAQGITAIGALGIAALLYWSLFHRAVARTGGSPVKGVVLGLVLFFSLAIAHAFSFTYAYTIAAFQGAGLPTFCIATLLSFGGLLLRHGTPAEVSRPTPFRWGWLITVLIWVSVVASTALHFVPLRGPIDTIRLATYNIHYGFDTNWHLSLEEQARAIAQSNADIVALQEVDTGRLTSYGIDDAYWLGRRLGMKVVYLPTVEHTTGIALLSRIPLEAPATLLLPSQQEPTGIIGATVQVAGERVRVHGVWLGLTENERALQMEAALAFMGKGRATLAGDLNAEPKSPTWQRLQAAGFQDAFLTLTPNPPPTDPAISPRKRIDYVWLRGLRAVSGEVLPSLASDHRLVVIEALPE